MLGETHWTQSLPVMYEGADFLLIDVSDNADAISDHRFMRIDKSTFAGFDFVEFR